MRFYIQGIAQLLLAENVSLNIVNELGDSPLHGAMFGNKVKIVDMLIKAGKCYSTFLSKRPFDKT